MRCDQAVHVGGKISVRIEQRHLVRRQTISRDRNPPHEDVIGNQRECRNGNKGAGTPAEKINHAHDQVTDRYSLQDTVDAPRRQWKMRKAVDDKAKAEKEEGPADNVKEQFSSRSPLRQSRFY